MKKQHTDVSRTDATSSGLPRSWVIGGVSLALLTTSWGLVMGFPTRASFTRPMPSASSSTSALAQDSLQTRAEPPVPQFPKGGPSPQGRVRLPDITLEPSWPPRVATLFGTRLVPDYRNKQLTITDLRTEKRVWTGTVAEADFTLESVEGQDTLRDAGNRILWTYAHAAPDLRLDIVPDGTGNARLSDRTGTTLWTGRVTMPASAGSSSSYRGDAKGVSSVMSAYGVTIKGVNGRFLVTDTDQNLLWSGQLPRDAVVLIRCGRRSVVQGPDRAGSSYDTVVRYRFEPQAGRITITGLDGKTIGRLPTEDVVIHTSRKEIGKDTDWVPMPFNAGSHARIPNLNPTLSVTGTIFLTYEDATGRVIRRAKAYRDKREYGYRST
jgi:hypothetical protein